METFDLLLTMAEVAVGLAGFSAIIVTLNRRPIREWDDTDQLNLRLLIQVSGLTIFFRYYLYFCRFHSQSRTPGSMDC